MTKNSKYRILKFVQSLEKGNQMAYNINVDFLNCHLREQQSHVIKLSAAKEVIL